MLALTRARCGDLPRAVCLVVAGLLLAGCGINTIPTLQEQAKAAWSEVLNQYQRRADLIPNLVETVKGFAAQEQEVLTQVVEARRRTFSPIPRPSRNFRRLRTISPARSGA